VDDAALFLREAVHRIDAQMSKEASIQAAINLALGMERILKEILWRVNPLFILINPGFKNAMPLLYGEKVLPEEKTSSELAANPDGDVLTFRNSLLRACTCSKVTLANKGLLFHISSVRDVLAHNRLALIDFEKLKVMLQRDVYPLLKSYAGELDYSLGKFLVGQDIKLAELSAKLEPDVAQSLQRLLDSHKSRWNQLHKNAGYTEDKDAVTAEVLTSSYKVPMQCPACFNKAVVYGKPEFEYSALEQKEVLIGVRVGRLRCHYCKLDLSDYKYIDHLGLNGVFASDKLSAEKTS
jgi:ribosomal protein S27E